MSRRTTVIVAAIALVVVLVVGVLLIRIGSFQTSMLYDGMTVQASTLNASNLTFNAPTLPR